MTCITMRPNFSLKNDWPLLAVLVALLLALAVTAASAQPPKPGPDWVLVTVNGEQGWVPPSHPLAQTVLQTPPADPCNPVPNAYTEPERASECARLTRRNGTPTAYAVGQTYRHAYPTETMIVLSLTRTLDGVTVVTGQYLTHSVATMVGQVFAFKANVPQPWQVIP